MGDLGQLSPTGSAYTFAATVDPVASPWRTTSRTTQVVPLTSIVSPTFGVGHRQNDAPDRGREFDVDSVEVDAHLG